MSSGIIVVAMNDECCGFALESVVANRRLLVYMEMMVRGQRPFGLWR